MNGPSFMYMQPIIIATEILINEWHKPSCNE